jgi:hypothetical protein
MIPQILVLGILFMALGIDLVRHGKTHEVTENFWTTLLSFVIWIGLLYWGHFFDVFWR